MDGKPESAKDVIEQAYEAINKALHYHDKMRFDYRTFHELVDAQYACNSFLKRRTK